MDAIEGIVVKRKILNKFLAFFDVEQSNGSCIQVRVKSIELLYYHRKGNVILYSTDQLEDYEQITDWRVNTIHVGTRIKVKGHQEETERGTLRFITEWISIDLESQENSSTSRNIQPKIQKTVLCKSWARKEFIKEKYNNLEDIPHIIHWNDSVCSIPCIHNHFWISEKEKESVFTHSVRLEEELRREYDPNDPFHHSETISRTKRAQLFADWVYKLSQEQNWKNITIIDVAGGSGALLRELLVRLYSICNSCYLIEPNTRNTTPETLLSAVRTRINNEEYTPEIHFVHSYFTKEFYEDVENIGLFQSENTLSMF